MGWNKDTNDYEAEKCIHVGTCRIYLDYPYDTIHYMSLDAGEQVLITPEKDDVWVFYHSLWTLFEKPRDPVTDYDSQEVISRSKRHFGSKFDRIARISGDKIWINCGPLSVHIAEEKLKSCFQDMQAAVGLLPEGLREKFLVQTVID